MIKKEIIKYLKKEIILFSESLGAKVIDFDEIILDYKIDDPNELLKDCIDVLLSLKNEISTLRNKSIDIYISIDLLERERFIGSEILDLNLDKEIDRSTIPQIIVYYSEASFYTKSELYSVPVYSKSNQVIFLYKEYRTQEFVEEGFDYLRELNLILS